MARKAAPGGDPAAPSQRQRRVAEEVRHALSAIFMRETFHDEALLDLKITVTEVRASPDLRHMTAFVSGLGHELSPAQFKGLQRIAPFLRRQVAQSVRLKFAPNLHFQPDTALDYALKIATLMQRPEIQRDLAAPPPDPKPDPEPDSHKDRETP